MDKGSLDQLVSLFNADRNARIKGTAPALIPVVSEEPNSFSAIQSPNAWRFLRSFNDYAPLYQNWVTLKSLELQLEYEPGSYISQIGSIPKLFILALEDGMIPDVQIKDVYQRASEPKNIVEIKGHHFTPYMEGLDEAAKIAIDWFSNHL